MNDDVLPVTQQRDGAAVGHKAGRKPGARGVGEHAVVGDRAGAAGAVRVAGGPGIGARRRRLDDAVVARVAHGLIPEAQPALVALENVCVIRADSIRSQVSVYQIRTSPVPIVQIFAQFRSSRIALFEHFDYN